MGIRSEQLNPLVVRHALMNTLGIIDCGQNPERKVTLNILGISWQLVSI